MELQQVLQNRRSVRKFAPEPVSKEAIDTLMHAAMSGPSACNRRPWMFYVISNGDMLSRLHGVTPFSNMQAPLAIVVCGNTHRALPLQLSEYWVQDCSAATENILLSATDLGLGAVWCGIYPQKRNVKKLQDILGLKPHLIPLNIIYLGHPAETPEPRDQYEAACVQTVE